MNLDELPERPPMLRRHNAINSTNMTRAEWTQAIVNEHERARQRYPSPPRAQRPARGRAQIIQDGPAERVYYPRAQSPKAAAQSSSLKVGGRKSNRKSRRGKKSRRK